MPNYLKRRYLRPTYPSPSVTGDLPNGIVGDGTDGFAYEATGGFGVKTFSLASGALPTGLTLNADGSVTGTFSAVGDFSWSVIATDEEGTPSSPHADSCEVFALPVISGSAPPGFVGVAYEYAYSLSSGEPPYVCTIHAGALPDGLSLSEAGVISGEPTTIDYSPSTFTVRVTDANALTDDLPDAIPVEATPVTFVTNRMYYTGELDALELGESMGWASGVATAVSVSPGGQYAVGFNPGSSIGTYFQIRKFNPDTLGFDAVANPAVFPDEGPRTATWHPSGDYLLLTDYTTGAENWLIYARDGDTFTKIDDPAEWPSNESRYSAWSFDGTKFAVNNQITNDQLAVYDFDAEAGTIGALNDGLNVVNGENVTAISWQPISGSDILFAITTGEKLAVVDTSTSPPTKTAQAAVANIISAFWTADGEYIVAVCGATDYLRVYEYTGSALNLVAATIGQPAWVPQGVGVKRDRTGFVLVRNVGGGTVYPPYPYSISSAQPPVLAAITPPVDQGTVLTTLAVVPDPAD